MAGLHSRSKELAYFYDLGRRIAGASDLPGSAGVQLGEALFKAAAANGFVLKGASLDGPPLEILSVVKSIIPHGNKKEHFTVGLLTELRVIYAPRTLSGRIGAACDRFVPRLSVDSLDRLVSDEKRSSAEEWRLKTEIDTVQKRQETLLSKARSELHYLGLGNQAYIEIMSAIYRDGQGKSLEENITEMLDVVTKWAYQVIGRSPDSEAAGWLVVGPDGQIGIPYRYLIPGETLESSDIVPLRQKGGGLTLSAKESKGEIADERGRYLTIAEWEEWSRMVREDLVVVNDRFGRRRLFQREIRPGSELIKHVVGGAAGELMGEVAQGATKLLGDRNALIELKPITLEEAGVKKGEIIPVVADGTRIKLVSAGSTNENLREEKIRKGSKIEQLSARGGQPVGIVRQELSRAIGNVRTSAILPLRLMIEDAKRFSRRPQNEFLLKIVGVASYFITSIFKYNELGEAVCLGCLEVTNPEIIPEKMTPEETARLDHQFKSGQAFAELISTGIMIKVLQEERNNLTRQYVGEKVYDLLRSRDYLALRGRQIDDATIMFADVSGFTALSDILRDLPEEVVGLLSRLFARLDPIITRYGGMVDKHIGDCIMGNFGVPRRESGDVEGGVTAAIELQLALRRLNLDPGIRATFKRYGIKPLGVTIGLHTGRVIAGNVGHVGSKLEYTVIGDAVNQAARLQHAVSRGQVLIGERTYNLLSGEYKEGMIADFNSYNRGLDSPKGRAYLRQFLADQGVEPSDELIDRVITEYQANYRDAAEEDLFVPCTIYAKNKGVLPGYFVRWDRHAYRWPFLRAALERSGIRLEREPDFENQPLSAENVHQLWQGESDERQVELFESYLELKERQNAKLRKS